MSAAVFGDVTSANIVGYSAKALNDAGGEMAAPQFAKVGNSDHAATFGDLVPLKADGTPADSMTMTIQYLKSDGSDSATYMWRGTYWRNQDTRQDVSDEVIPAGQGLWVLNNSGGSATIRSSGEVSKADAQITLNLAGGTQVGNPYPVDITFGDIIPKDNDGNLPDSMTMTIQYLKSDGSDSATYMWRGTYWRNQDTRQDVSDEVIPAGKGLWMLNNTGKAMTVYIAAPTSSL